MKQSIFGRMAQLAKANINSLLDQAEDPQKMLDQMVRDYTNNIAEAESAVAQTIGNLRMLQDDYNEDIKNAQDWGKKALAASRKADEYRAKGDIVDAEKFDNLAKVALQRQMSAENEAKSAEPSIASQTEVVDKLKHGLGQMKGKLNELTVQAQRTGGPLQDRCGPDAGARCHEEHRLHGPHVARWAASKRRSAAKKPRCGASRNSPPPAWTPSSTRWRTSASRPRSRRGSRR